MTDAARGRLAGLLAGIGEPQTFSAARTAPVGDLHLEVRGVGPIRLPVPAAQAKKLCLLSRPARYGRGEDTLLDSNVRDTWEVPKSRVKIDKRRWSQTLLPMLERLSRDLCLPAGSTLKPELHSMLVYAPGQFFLEHQDAEKADAMVGSLVVGLPSAFTGGALEVRHGGETATYRGSKKALSFAAFYSDCRHQVKPVTSGYRIVLTYNLVLERERSASPAIADPGLVSSLARCLDQHFGQPDAPDRLVYLLDHEYTPLGLDWSRLKGTDVQSTELLGAAAKDVDCEIALALVDIHETWSAYEEDYWRPRHRWSRYGEWEYEDEGDSSGGGGDYELQELIESDTTLGAWVDASGSRLKQVEITVDDDEVCAATAVDDLDPYRSEYEGYMGNWGNTLDRWYHRGAVVLWPRALDFVVRAELSPAWALDSLARRVRAGDLPGAQEDAATLVPLWDQAVSQAEARGFFTKALRAAHLIDDPVLATMLLKPFRMEALTPSHAKPLGTLLQQYGEPWWRSLVAAWRQRYRFLFSVGPQREEWIASLPAMCAALQEAGDGGTAAARVLLEQSWQWLREAIEERLGQSAPSRREESLSKLQRPIAALVEGASVVAATGLRDEVVAVLCRDEEDLVGCAVGVLRTTPISRWRSAGLDAVATHCATALEARLACPARADDDWSIELPPGCRCELCDELRRFLQDRARQRFEWPLAKDRRAHLHDRIKMAELPVTHQTHRQGRPYVLVLEKTDELFKAERQHRAHDERDLAWLGRSRSAPARRRAGSK